MSFAITMGKVAFGNRDDKHPGNPRLKSVELFTDNQPGEDVNPQLYRFPLGGFSPFDRFLKPGEPYTSTSIIKIVNAFFQAKQAGQPEEPGVVGASNTKEDLPEDLRLNTINNKAILDRMVLIPYPGREALPEALRQKLEEELREPIEPVDI